MGAQRPLARGAPPPGGRNPLPLPEVRRFTRGLASTAVGLMLASSLNLSQSSMSAPVAWVVLAVAMGLMLFTRMPTLVSLAIGTGLGVGVVRLVPGWM
jgi:chromate transport protein ChrA